MSVEIANPISGLMDPILLAPDGLRCALEAEPQLANRFFDETEESAINTLQVLGDDLHEFQRVDVSALRAAVFHLTLLGECSADQKKAALSLVATHLEAIPFEAFKKAVDGIVSRKKIDRFKRTDQTKRLVQAVLERSSFLQKEVPPPEQPRKRRTPAGLPRAA